MTRHCLFLLLAALVLYQASGRLLPPRKLLLPITPYPTPSMIDIQTWNFTKPSDFARNCLKNQLGKSIVDVCQQQSENDYDPYKMKSTTSQTWEMCCSLYDELMCYVDNANNFCQANLAKAVAAYSRKVGYYFAYSICKSVPFSSWHRSCNNETHANEVKRHDDTQKKHPNYTPNFINIPQATGHTERACLRKLALNFTVVNQKQISQQQACLNKASDVWDPLRRKLKESQVLESCCATYQTLDCLVATARLTCTSSELTAMHNYQKQSNVALSSAICKSVPAEQRAQLCKNGSHAVVPSIIAAISTMLVVLRLYC